VYRIFGDIENAKIWFEKALNISKELKLGSLIEETEWKLDDCLLID
jgi:hypothetical protein